MANRCFTIYKITGYKPALESLVKALEENKQGTYEINLSYLAKYYNIDYEKECISVRGWVEHWVYNDDVLTIETDTAWSGCHNLFYAINRELQEIYNEELSISYREEEYGCNIFYIHDEEEFFPEECVIDYDISKDGRNYADVDYTSISKAIGLWCSFIGEEQGDRTDKEMLDYIFQYEHKNPSDYFNINVFDRE